MPGVLQDTRHRWPVLLDTQDSVSKKKGSVRFLLSWNDRAHIPAI
jgi:hypothetical protein